MGARDFDFEKINPCSHPKWPAEFFSLAELMAMAGTVQVALIRKWLEKERIQFVNSRSGYPLVYRSKLVPFIPDSNLPSSSEVKANYSSFSRRGKTKKT